MGGYLGCLFTGGHRHARHRRHHHHCAHRCCGRHRRTNGHRRPTHGCHHRHHSGAYHHRPRVHPCSPARTRRGDPPRARRCRLPPAHPVHPRNARRPSSGPPGRAPPSRTHAPPSHPRIHKPQLPRARPRHWASRLHVTEHRRPARITRQPATEPCPADPTARGRQVRVGENRRTMIRREHRAAATEPDWRAPHETMSGEERVTTAEREPPREESEPPREEPATKSEAEAKPKPEWRVAPR